MADDENGGWHLDKRVPLALMFGLLMQAGVFGWWAAAIDGRVAVTERDINRVERQIQVMTTAAQQQAVQLGRIEENLSALRGDIARMVRALESRP